MNWQETTFYIGFFALRIGLPLLVTLGIGSLIARAYDARRTVQLQTIPYAQGDVELGPRCWEVKGCDPSIRASCPAFQRPQIPCWLAHQLAGRELPEECFACDIFKRAQPVMQATS